MAIHRMSDSKIYNLWGGMKSRCYNPNHKDYSSYGGRGIKICERWLEPGGRGFMNFYADMGERPEGMTLDRVDVNGDYEPNNCRWADNMTQVRNKRNVPRSSIGELGVRMRVLDTGNIRYHAHIRSEGVLKFIGSFKTLEEAVSARKAEEIRVYGYILNRGVE